MSEEAREAIDPASVAWVAADWGTSNLRAWALDGEGRILATRDAPRGTATLNGSEYESVLLQTIDGWLGERRTPVLVCGMAGARRGWVETPYVPVAPDADALGALADRLTAAPVRDERTEVWIVPGLCQRPAADGETFDVMRGEETQLLGLVARHPAFTGAACLPGTHAKWVRLESGRVQRFTTYLTGELYGVLRRHSVLAHSVSGADPMAASAHTDAFLAGVNAATADPAGVSAELFGIRARDVLDTALPDDRAAQLDARLSGLLIGLELAHATASLDRGQTVPLIGSDTLCGPYQRALEHLGLRATRHADAAMTLAGLGRIRRRRTTSEGGT